jgi:hypothetical protein
MLIAAVGTCSNMLEGSTVSQSAWKAIIVFGSLRFERRQQKREVTTCTSLVLRWPCQLRSSEAFQLKPGHLSTACTCSVPAFFDGHAPRNESVIVGLTDRRDAV